MAVVSMMRMSGDPDELAQKLQGIADVGRRLAPSTVVWERSLRRPTTGSW